VIAPANTFVATIEAITQAGGRPVLVDVDEDDHGIDVDAVDAAVTPETAVVVPVHLYGQLADMASLGDLVGRRRLALVEDACQAHGASRDGIRPGQRSTAAAFSFYPAKNLGALGDAGACVTQDENLARQVRSLREHGQERKYEHDREGWTARLDTVHAIALLHRLPRLDDANRQRATAASIYSEQLRDVGDLRLPAVAPDSHHAWHLYVVRTADPAGLASFMAKRGVASGRHYPHPVHLSRSYAHLGHRPGEFPVSERLAREVLSLPLFPGITEPQLGRVITAVRDYFGSARAA
jgi:dTDP-4-amino-4,6-dideoxygalactose transaminase